MTLRRIGLLTSGGDAPGMNPAIRAVVRAAAHYGIEVIGIRRGYAGLIEEDLGPLSVRDVGGIISRGGTILQTARLPEFREERLQRDAVRILDHHGIDALVVIGGDGSLRGAHALARRGVPVVGIPATIDNDLHGTDMSIGVDTALNTVLRAIDAIRDTASSHRRAFLVETMGRDSGYLALMGGIAGGAEIILIPEVPFTLREVEQGIREAYRRGKAHCLIIVAEGSAYRAQAIAQYLEERRSGHGFQIRVTILGHVQRGGIPSAFDRTLATRMGFAAVEFLRRQETDVMTGLAPGRIVPVPLEEVVANPKKLDLSLYQMFRILEFPKGTG